VPTAADRLLALLSEPRVRREPLSRIARAIERLWRLAAKDAALFIRVHDRLLFLLAYPPSRSLAGKIEALLDRVPALVRRLEEAGADVSVFDDPEVAGVAGTTVTTDFSFDLVRWLKARHRRRVQIDWGACDAPDRMRATWPHFVPLLEEEALADANVPYSEWLRAAAGGRSRDVGWLLRRYERLPYSAGDAAERWDTLGVPVAWDLGGTLASRTRMRRPGPAPFVHEGPLLTRRDVSLAEVFAAPPLKMRRLSRREGEKVCDLVREATAARYREFYTFTFADPGSVLSVRPGRGVELFLLGVGPGRRLPLRAAYGGFVVKNGVPIGYIEGLAFFERLEIGFNMYYAFREGESAWIYARVMKFHRDALGVTSFSIDPYQLGSENEEAIASGAFWFYRKLGFRPTNPGVAALAGREEARLARDPSYRSSPRTLRRLVTHNLLYEVPGTASGEWNRFHIRNLGLAVNRVMARRFGGSAPRIRAASEKRVAAELRLRPERLPPLERKVFQDFALVLALLPDSSRWTREERQAMRSLLRAKVGSNERGYLRLMQRHRLLRRAILRLGSRISPVP
jgi:hypothetical protein